jgi:hypothetical protein
MGDEERVLVSRGWAESSRRNLEAVGQENSYLLAEVKKLQKQLVAIKGGSRKAFSDILEANIAASLRGLLWCLKYHLNKAVGRAFRKWSSHIASPRGFETDAIDNKALEQRRQHLLFVARRILTDEKTAPLMDSTSSSSLFKVGSPQKSGSPYRRSRAHRGHPSVSSEPFFGTNTGSSSLDAWQSAASQAGQARPDPEPLRLPLSGLPSPVRSLGGINKSYQSVFSIDHAPADGSFAHGKHTLGPASSSLRPASAERQQPSFMKGTHSSSKRREVNSRRTPSLRPPRLQRANSEDLTLRRRVSLSSSRKKAPPSERIAHQPWKNVDDKNRRMEPSQRQLLLGALY